MSFDLKLVSGNLSIKNGDFETVTSSDKLLQDILKICLTKAGSNPIFPWYGSFINQTMIGSVLDKKITIDYAKNQLTNSLTTLKQLQEKQSQYQSVSPDELIYTISNVSIVQNQYEPTLYSVLLKVVSKNFKTINTSFKI